MLLFGRERSGRLVEDDDLRVVMNGARNFDHLLLTRAEARDDRRWIDREVERLQELLAGDVDTAQPVERLGVTQVQILSDRQRGNQAGFLIHHRYAMAERVRRICQDNLPAVEKEFAG
jgi:hypothetical protein